jgi:hypothetical protein
MVSREPLLEGIACAQYDCIVQNVAEIIRHGQTYAQRWSRLAEGHSKLNSQLVHDQVFEISFA